MPIYEYKCKCGYSGELIVPVSERNNAACPECGVILTRQFKSFPNIRMAIPLTFYQERPYGQKPVKIGEIANSSRDWEPNYNIPPDYPNLTEV